MAAVLGGIADDFTGATDLAGALVRAGMRSVQMIGVPAIPAAAIDAEAVVIAFKSRTVPADEAIAQSLEDAAYATEALEEAAKLYLLLHGRKPRCLTQAPIAELRETFSLP